MIRVFVRSKPGRKFLQLYYDDPATGREKSRSAKTADRSEALKAAARWEDELRLQRGDNDDGWEWFKLRFVDEHCINVAADTRSACIAALKHYQRIMSPRVVGDVTADRLSQFAARLHGEDRPRATVDQILRHLQVALRFAARIGMIDRCPHVPISKGARRKFMRGRPVTYVEFRRMLRHAEAAAGKRSAPGFRRLLEFLNLSGFRIEEAVVASWDSPPVKVELAVKPYPQVLFYAADDAADQDAGQKSGNDEAWSMPPDLAAWLEKTPKPKRHGPVCPLIGDTGKAITDPGHVSRLVARIGRAAGIVVGKKKETDPKTGRKVVVDRYAAAHDIRRGFGVRWALQVLPVVVQKLMRHKDISTTMKYYVHLDASQVGAVLWKQVSPETSPRKPKRRA